MLLDFSADWQWIIGGTDVSPFVETWELAREQPDMGTPAWWRGKLVLRPVVGRDLNLDPLTNSLWQQGTSCSLIVDGYLVFTGSILLAYYDDWSTDPKLELEVGDVLAAKNHRQVIPFGEYEAQSLLAMLGIPGVAPAGDAVEISTDLTSPVKVVQELTWVTWLKEKGIPATLFTRSDGQVDYASPQADISLTRTLRQVADFTRQRPALEIPGAVVASASLSYLVQAMEPINEEIRGEPIVIVARKGDVITATYLDSLNRIAKEEIYKEVEFRRVIRDIFGNIIREEIRTKRILEGYTTYHYDINRQEYEITKTVFTSRIVTRIQGAETVKVRIYEKYERTQERVERTESSISNNTIQGQLVARKITTIEWPSWRLAPTIDPDIDQRLFLVYLVEEYSILGQPVGFNISSSQILIPYLLRLTRRARGTTEDFDTIEGAVVLSSAISEIIPNQQIQFPDWAQRFWSSLESTQTTKLTERVTDVLSEEMAVVGFTGPPVYVSVPWLSVTVDEQPGSRDLERRIEALRQRIKFALQAAATWMAIEIAGRVFARRIKMPVPSEWLSDPRPWTLARIGDEVLWLVGETLRGTGQGVEFEATGILAGRPSTIPPGEFPPGTIPSFVPLITVVPTRFPQVGIGCVMQAGEAVFIPGDPWLGMAVEIEYSVSAPVDTSAIVGIGVGELTEAWLGMASDATHEIEGNEDDEDDSGSETEGLTLEAENGEISGGAAVIVYDTDASSCYAVEAENSYFTVDLSVDSTSLDWERPLRIRVIYKAEDEGEIYVYTIRGEESPSVGYWTVSATTGYINMDLIIPAGAEPFNGIRVEVVEYPGKIRIDAIQLAPATGDWPPLNPCEG